MDKLTKGEQFVYNWQYRLEDENSFNGLLAKLIAKADLRNQEKISLGFPEEVEAIQSFQTDAGWWERLEDKFNDNHILIFHDHSPQTNVATKVKTRR